MSGTDSNSPDVWSLLLLRKLTINPRSEPVRTWITIVICALAITFAFCCLLSAALLVRLGWDALWSPHPAYQEAARNFLLAFAGAFGAPFLVWRSWVAHKQANAATEQARVALENHVTGIFSKSVELMGLERESKSLSKDGVTVTTSVPNTEARLGALYSLARLLEESEKDRRAILETLCAYIRENSRFEIPDDKDEASRFRNGDLPPTTARRADVQVALAIVGRRSNRVRERTAAEGWRLDLRNSNLIAYDFSGLNYDKTDFGNSFLNGANLSGASFDNCIFSHTFFRGANMAFTSFRHSIIDNCDFNNAKLKCTNFGFATLVSTDLRRADVESFDIKGANLEQAFGSLFDYVLENAKSTGPNSYNAQEIVGMFQLFQKATYDNTTSVSVSVRETIEIMMASQPQAADATGIQQS